ncbi:unnamed protein product [Cuscuta europaea]|uniref:Uncharacterized protein n=1 Tax=Cuscuta europaea TaxID=41803 RepID=A0A9P1E8I7_CUSEU|nr:unnamed protein product [Cuscuta europaea]
MVVPLRRIAGENYYVRGHCRCFDIDADELCWFWLEGLARKCVEGMRGNEQGSVGLEERNSATGFVPSEGVRTPHTNTSEVPSAFFEEESQHDAADENMEEDESHERIQAEFNDQDDHNTDVHVEDRRSR